MNAKTDDIPTGFERFNALLAWWGPPNEMDLDNVDGHTRRFQMLVADLGQAFNEASSSQIQTLIAMNEQLARSLRDLLYSRQPQELMMAQASVVAGLLESLADQTKTWAEITRKMHGYCATMAREMAEELAEQGCGNATAVFEKQAVPDRPAGKESVKHAARG